MISRGGRDDEAKLTMFHLARPSSRHRTNGAVTSVSGRRMPGLARCLAFRLLAAARFGGCYRCGESEELDYSLNILWAYFGGGRWRARPAEPDNVEGARVGSVQR